MQTSLDLGSALLAARPFLPDSRGAVLLVHKGDGGWEVSAASYANTRDKDATAEEMRELVSCAPIAAKVWSQQIDAEAARVSKAGAQ